jgi:potassium-transporting ATPase KdpC subunit
MYNQLKSGLILLMLFTLLTGLLYPFLITGIAQGIFPRQANGSLIIKNGVVVGSQLIGQYFDKPGYFWGRPSVTTPLPYNAAASTGSNLGPSNSALQDAVRARIAALHTVDPGNTQPIPIDLVTASASGLDPDISVAAALYQVARVARTRGLPETIVRTLVADHIEKRLFGILGEPRVNVLELNLALDRIQ